MLSGGNACACYVRSLSVGNGNNAFAATARPWCREASTVTAKRPWLYSQLAPGKGRRCFRSVGSTPFWSPSRTSTCSKGGSSKRNDPSVWKIASVFAAIASGACFDRLGTTDKGGTDDDRTVFGGIKGPMVASMTQRRDTQSIQIRFGGSVLLDHVERLSSTTVAGANDDDILLVSPEDELTISPFLYYLMTRVQLVRIQEDDRDVYNLPIGVPGLACVHCSSWSRKKTRSQIFPMDRRTFPAQVRQILYNHVRHCERCPPEVKLELRRLKKLEVGTKISREERLFFKRLWFRMGHKKEI